jgi:hypothetical protein
MQYHNWEDYDLKKSTEIVMHAVECVLMYEM